MDDMSDMTSQDAQDAAFDAQCRDLLQGRIEVAPDPADDLFANAEATRSRGRRIGVAAVALLGAAAWGISQYSTDEPVTEPVDLAAEPVVPRSTDEVTDWMSQPASDAIPAEADHPVPASPPKAVPTTSSDALPPATESAVEVAVSNPAIVEDAPDTESSPSSAAVKVQPPVEAEDGAITAPESEVLLDSEESGQPVEQPVAPEGEEEAPGEVKPTAPTLTLPLTLPAGGGL